MAELNKKGIFFTFIAITIMAIFILVYTPQADISLQKDKQSIEARIISVDSYVDDLENSYFEAVLGAAAYKTILSLIFYMNETNSYIADFDAAFSEVMINGTLNNAPIDNITGKKIMENSTLTKWSNKIIETAKDALNVNTSIIVNNVSAFQTSPWNMDLILSINLSVKSNVAEWNKVAAISATIGIEDFYDPYYLVNTNGMYINQIEKSTVQSSQWNMTNAREHLRNGTYVYRQNSDAPSFLMRFTNTISNSSCCGIESLVNPNKTSPRDQIDSYVDYLFWSHKFANNCTQLYNVTGLWDEFRYFKLDFEHAIKYNITEQDAIRTCR